MQAIATCPCGQPLTFCRDCVAFHRLCDSCERERLLNAMRVLMAVRAATR